MILIASVNTVPGDNYILINDDESEEDDFCVYDIDNITGRMISSVHVQEAPKVEHVRISDLRRHKAEKEKLVETKTFSFKQKHLSLEAAILSEQWGIIVAQDALTLKYKTQKYMRSALLTLAQQYRVDRMFGQKMFNVQVYTDKIDARLTTIHGN